MSMSVKSIALWRKELVDHPGALAETLAPLAKAGADLQVVMAYRLPGAPKMAAFELYPVKGKKAVAAAQAAGLQESHIPALLVESENKPGAGAAICQALNAAGINLDFLVGQTIGRKYSMALGFESPEDAQKAASCIKQLARRKK